MQANKDMPTISARKRQRAAAAGVWDSKATLKKLCRIELVKEGIARNVSLILILGSLLAIAGVIFVLMQNEQHNSAKRTMAYGATLTDFLSQVAAQYVAEDRADQLQELLRVIKDRSLAYGMVVDPVNRILAHTDGKQRGRRFEPPAASHAPTALSLTTTVYGDPGSGQTIWHFSRPIDTAIRHVGTLYIGLVAESSRTVFVQLRETFGLIALIIFFLVPMVYYLLRVLLRPLRKLNARLEEMATGKQFQVLEGTYSSEIGDLVAHWNQAMTQLQERYESVSAANLEAELTINILSYEKRRLAMILDKLSDAILITDSSDKIIFANKITETFLNTSIHSIIGKKLNECFHNEEMLNLFAIYEDTKHEMRVRSVETKLDYSDSEFFKASLFSIVDERENITNMCLIMRNISQQKNAERARGEFVSAVAHEVKTPLTTIKSYTELLINNVVEDNETKYVFYNTINDETDRLVRLINNLLNLSKIEMGSLHIKPTRVRMKKLLQDSFQAVESQAMAKNITFEIRLPEKLAALEGDKDLLGTVVMNLLSNALKYTPEQGEVLLLADETEEEVLIHVQDTGIGIEEADLPHIFERFYRGSNGEKTQPGSGLGLALAHQIVQLHGGSMKVVSQVNQGSQFSVMLPKNLKEQELLDVGR